MLAAVGYKGVLLKTEEETLRLGQWKAATNTEGGAVEEKYWKKLNMLVKGQILIASKTR